MGCSSTGSMLVVVPVNRCNWLGKDPISNSHRTLLWCSAWNHIWRCIRRAVLFSRWWAVCFHTCIDCHLRCRPTWTQHPNTTAHSTMDWVRPSVERWARGSGCTNRHSNRRCTGWFALLYVLGWCTTRKSKWGWSRGGREFEPTWCGREERLLKHPRKR